MLYNHLLALAGLTGIRWAITFSLSTQCFHQDIAQVTDLRPLCSVDTLQLWIGSLLYKEGALLSIFLCICPNDGCNSAKKSDFFILGIDPVLTERYCEQGGDYCRLGIRVVLTVRLTYPSLLRLVHCSLRVCLRKPRLLSELQWQVVKESSRGLTQGSLSRAI